MNSEKDPFYSYLFEEDHKGIFSGKVFQHECLFKKCCKKYKKPGKKHCKKCPKV